MAKKLSLEEMIDLENSIEFNLEENGITPDNVLVLFFGDVIKVEATCEEAVHNEINKIIEDIFSAKLHNVEYVRGDLDGDYTANHIFDNRKVK